MNMTVYAGSPNDLVLPLPRSCVVALVRDQSYLIWPCVGVCVSVVDGADKLSGDGHALSLH